MSKRPISPSLLFYEESDPEQSDAEPTVAVCVPCDEPSSSAPKKRVYKKCPHGKRRSKCKECGGVSICPHGKERSYCKECGGSQICPHRRQRNTCKECGGSRICPHKRIRSVCKECGGSQICLHGKQRSRCKECGGSQICPHGRLRSKCKECGGSEICPHGKQRSHCKECGGASICPHKRQRSQCKECGGSQICQHGRQRSQCAECGGTTNVCKYHKESLCGMQVDSSSNRFDGACTRCFVFYNPNDPRATEANKRAHVKEQIVSDAVQQKFPQIKWVCDKRIRSAHNDNFSLVRPDMLALMRSAGVDTHDLIIETDEGRHRSYDCKDERTRLMAVWRNLSECKKPLVVLRINPDDYVDPSTGKMVTTCFAWSKAKLKVGVKPSKLDEWADRLEKLFQRIAHWVVNRPERDLWVEELFF